MNKKFTIHKYLIHIIGLFPFLFLGIYSLLDRFSINPIQTLEQQTGRIALIFLILSFACSPISRIFDLGFLVIWRKYFGLYGFLYAVIHFMIFIGIDYGFQFNSILRDIRTQYFIWFGAAGLFLSLPLAITSNSFWMKHLKEKWKKLHQLLYLILMLIMIHFFLSIKGNLLQFQGNIQLPIVLLLLIAVLSVLRVQALQKILIQFRMGIFHQRQD